MTLQSLHFLEFYNNFIVRGSLIGRLGAIAAARHLRDASVLKVGKFFKFYFIILM